MKEKCLETAGLTRQPSPGLMDWSATITMNMAVSESHIDPLAVYAAHSFADDQAYQVSPIVARAIFHS